MSNSITGKVIKVMHIETGSGSKGEWKKQQFVIETNDQYPKKVCFDAFGKSVEYSKNLKEGQEVTVSYNLESREYNNRWYTSVSPWKIEGGASGNIPTSSLPQNNINSEDEDLPF